MFLYPHPYYQTVNSLRTLSYLSVNLLHFLIPCTVIDYKVSAKINYFFLHFSFGNLDTKTDKSIP